MAATAEHFDSFDVSWQPVTGLLYSFLFSGGSCGFPGLLASLDCVASLASMVLALVASIIRLFDFCGLRFL